MTIDFSSLRAQVSEAEWSTRVDLAAAYRLVALFGWDDLAFTHISARVPDADDQFLINPYGVFFDEITASSLVKVNHHGGQIIGPVSQINTAGFLIHSAVHEARPSVNCVVHTHTVHGVAVSAQENGLLPISQQAGFVLSSLAYHAYEGVALRPSEKITLAADLGNANSMILRNHGLLTCGRTVAEAFKAMYTLETACRIQVMAQAGGPLLHISESVLETMADRSREIARGFSSAELVWPGLLRRLNRQNPGYDV